MASERVQLQIDRLLDQAEQASAQDDWETVQNRARRALKFDPENADALTLAAAAERAQDGSPAITAVPETAPYSPDVELPSHFAPIRYNVMSLVSGSKEG